MAYGYGYKMARVEYLDDRVFQTLLHVFLLPLQHVDAVLQRVRLPLGSWREDAKVSQTHGGKRKTFSTRNPNSLEGLGRSP